MNAALTNGVPRESVLHWHEGAFEMVASRTLLFELQSVLMRGKFRRYRPEADCLDYILWISDNATLRREGRVELSQPRPRR